MSVIEASSVGVKTMADGTLRITLDIEPRHSKDAFNLFGAPGTPCALAALHCRSAAEQQEQPKTAGEPIKGGALAKLAGMWCNDPEFQDWSSYRSPEKAAQWIREVCGIESRAELDSDAKAAERFHMFIRGPYSKALIARGVTT